MTAKPSCKVRVETKTLPELVLELKAENEALKKELNRVLEEHTEKWDRILPQLPDEMRARSKAVWEAALFAHDRARDGEPTPIAVIARALLDAEKIGPRKLKGGIIDPVSFIAERVESIARANKKDPVDLFEKARRRMLESLDEAAEENDSTESVQSDDGSEQQSEG